MIRSYNKRTIAAVLIFAFGFLCVTYYILFKEKVEFNSDFTDTIIWAKAMLTGNGIYDTRMNYAYILPFGGSLLMMPFVALLGVNYTAHALSFICFLAIFSLALYLCFKAIGFSGNVSLVLTGAALALSCISKSSRMIMWGHIIHYSLGVLFVLIGIILFSKINPSDEKLSIKNKRTVISVAVFSLFSFLCCFNGFTIVLFFFIPLVGAIVIERFLDIKHDIFCTENINTLICVIISGISAAAGLLCNQLLLRNVKTVYDSLYTNIPMWQHWVWDLADRLRYFLVLIMGQNPSDISMATPGGIRMLFLALFAYIIIFVPFTAFISYKKFNNKYMRILVLSHAILVFSSMFIMNFSSARSNEWRLVGIYMSAVIVTLAYAAWLFKTYEYKRFSVMLAAFISLVSLLSLYQLISIPNETNRFERLGDVLYENGLTHGYAQYWSAQVTTVLSGSRVTVCPVDVSDDGQLIPFMFNIRDDEFSKGTENNKYFLFLSDYEYETLSDDYKNKCIDTIRFDDDGIILVFRESLFT